MNPSERTRIGRYELAALLGSGGMASVWLARLTGPGGFGRVFALKRLHPHLAQEPELATMLLDEARIAARLRHPNVVPILDVISDGQQVALVMEYVPGVPLNALLSRLRRDEERAPLDVASAMMTGLLAGLAAAHDAMDPSGAPLNIIHRDVSPQNVIVGQDGVVRLLDFGVAKARGRLMSTRGDQLKGKLAYMAPEQLAGAPLDRRVDLHAAAIVLWEVLVGTPLFAAEDEAATLGRVFLHQVSAPGTLVEGVPPALDQIVLRGLDKDPARRFARAEEMAAALARVVPPASSQRVAEWLDLVVGDLLEERLREVQGVEALPRISEAPPNSIASAPKPPALPTSGLPIPSLALPSLPTLPATQLSVAQLPSAPEPPLSSRRARPWRWVLLASAACGALLIGAFWPRLHERAVGASGAEEPGARAPLQFSATLTGPRATAAPSAATIASSAVAGAPRAGLGAVIPAPAPSHSSVGAARVRAAVSVAAAPRPRVGASTPSKRPASTTPKRESANCSPPYTLDERGKRHYKLECL
jgi:serine/threonine-protein kinase